MTASSAQDIRPPMERSQAVGDAEPAHGRRGSLGTEDLIRLRYLAVIGLVALNVIDLILTRHLLALGASEANPLMVLFVRGPWGIVIKLGVPILVGLRHLNRPVERLPVLALCWMNVLYLSVVTWNFHLMVQQYG